MNTALLMICGLVVSQVSAESLSVAELDGTHSILVKTESLVTPTPATAGEAPPLAMPADFPAEQPTGEMSPVPPMDRSTPSPELIVSPFVGAEPSPTLEPSVLPIQATAEESAVSAAQVLRDALAAPQRGGLIGIRLSLREALDGTSERNNQLQTVSAYWQLVAAMARYHYALDKHDLVSRLPPPAGARESVRLAAARAAATAKLREAELSAASMQFALAERVPQRAFNEPVVPTDAPLTGVYRTHFDSLFANRSAPAGLYRIDKTLPLRLAAIDAAATALDMAGQSVRLVENAYDTGEASLDELLHVVADLQSRHDTFIAAVRDYNIDIAAYALAVAGENVGPETLVSMLIDSAPRGASILIARHESTEGLPGPPAAMSAVGGPTLAVEPPTAGSGNPRPAAGLDFVPAGGVQPLAESNVVPDGTAANASATEQESSPVEPDASPFRDVTPSEISRPEVLVPLPPARYRSPILPSTAPLPSAPSLPADTFGGS